ncbi:hypothetical protein TS85_07695 [Sphingomonas hengshuiensis]|uniref:Uncharacterized protein n=1 Tax=Sphingomonas hengshuiensis TaxID=1609977 RepID=A0A7U4LES3_9SPHN|nr:hypothetical protein TS85_07695 [Sphingomonas hengshuiensis]
MMEWTMQISSSLRSTDKLIPATSCRYCSISCVEITDTAKPLRCNKQRLYLMRRRSFVIHRLS